MLNGPFLETDNIEVPRGIIPPVGYAWNFTFGSRYTHWLEPNVDYVLQTVGTYNNSEVLSGDVVVITSAGQFNLALKLESMLIPNAPSMTPLFSFLQLGFHPHQSLQWRESCLYGKYLTTKGKKLLLTLLVQCKNSNKLETAYECCVKVCRQYLNV